MRASLSARLCYRYDFTCTNWNIDDEDTDAVLHKQDFPDLLLVRKVCTVHLNLSVVVSWW